MNSEIGFQSLLFVVYYRLLYPYPIIHPLFCSCVEFSFIQDAVDVFVIPLVNIAVA